MTGLEWHLISLATFTAWGIAYLWVRRLNKRTVQIESEGLRLVLKGASTEQAIELFDHMVGSYKR